MSKETVRVNYSMLCDIIDAINLENTNIDYKLIDKKIVYFNVNQGYAEHKYIIQRISDGKYFQSTLNVFTKEVKDTKIHDRLSITETIRKVQLFEEWVEVKPVEKTVIEYE